MELPLQELDCLCESSQLKPIFQCPPPLQVALLVSQCWKETKNQGRANPAFSKPCLCLSGTRHFRHFRRFRRSEERSHCFLWVECKFVIFAVFVKTAPLGTKTQFTKNMVCAIPKKSTICTETITNENLEILFRFRFRNGKANKFPQIFFCICFRHGHVGHAQATTTGHACE